MENFFQEAWSQIYATFVEQDRYQYILRGIGITLQIAFFAVILGVILGVLIALGKVFSDHNKKLRWLEVICNIYTTVIRGTPMVVQLFIMYYIIINIQGFPKVWTSVIAFGLNSAAYVAEIVRSGIQSVDKGQMEAGRSLGLNRTQTMVKIIFPQALKNILPALGNEFIVLLKETSVAGFIGVEDLTKAGDILRSQTWQAYVPLFSVAIIYLIMVMGLTALLSRLERRLRKSDYR